MKNNLSFKINNRFKYRCQRVVLNFTIFFIFSFSFFLATPTFANKQIQPLSINPALSNLFEQIQNLNVYLPFTTFLDKQYFGNNLIIRESLSGKIGNIEYAPVKLDGRLVFQIASATSSLDIMNNKNKNDEIRILTVKDRVKVIENRLQSIVEQGFDEQTIRIIPAILNSYNVLMISDGSNSQNRVLVTFTDADFQLYGINPQEFVDLAAERLKQILIQAQQERQPSYLYKNVILAIELILRSAIIGLIIVLCQKLLFVSIKANKISLDK